MRRYDIAAAVVKVRTTLAATMVTLPADHIEKLIGSLTADWKTYHNAIHIADMLERLDEVKYQFRQLTDADIAALKLMIIYHDVVYELGKEKGWNERESARWAKADLMSVGASEWLQSYVTSGIIATINHDLAVVTRKFQPTVSLLLDLDLIAGLGTDWTEFKENTALIQQEFSPLYTAEQYQIGRKRWAEGFLKKERIFQTHYFKMYEIEVRKNLHRLATS